MAGLVAREKGPEDDLRPHGECEHGMRPKPGLDQPRDPLQLRPALRLQVCLDDRTEKIEKLAGEASESFEVQVEKGLTLLTIRHYKEEVFEKLTKDRKIVLIQRSPETVQVLMR